MNYLNLDKEKVTNTAKELNVLLADYHLYYQKLRNFHWNIVGKHFFDLHEKFEEMYDDAKLKVDEIAERILETRLTTGAHVFENRAHVCRAKGRFCEAHGNDYQRFAVGALHGQSLPLKVDSKGNSAFLYAGKYGCIKFAKGLLAFWK